MNYGTCADTLANWGASTSSECTCGAPNRTNSHITFEYPLPTSEVVEWLNSLDVAI